MGGWGRDPGDTGQGACASPLQPRAAQKRGKPIRTEVGKSGAGDGKRKGKTEKTV